MLRLQDLEPLLEEVKSIRETLHALAGRRAPEKV
jgi:hypothetical protein